MFIITYRYVNNKYHEAQVLIIEHNQLRLHLNSIQREIEHLDSTSTNKLNITTNLIELESDVERLYYHFFSKRENDSTRLDDKQEAYLGHNNDVLLVYDIRKSYDELKKDVESYVYLSYHHKNLKSAKNNAERPLLHVMKNRSSVLLQVLDEDLEQLEPYYLNRIDTWFSFERYVLYIFFIILFVITVYAGLNLYTVVILPIRHLYAFIKTKQGEGLLINRKYKDEITTLITAIVSNEEEINDLRKHLNKISKGELEISLISENQFRPKLLGVVQKLQKNLLDARLKSEHYNWVIEGSILLDTVLNKKFETTEQLVEEFLSVLVSYIKAKQGVVFVIGDAKEEELYLEPKGVYAFGVKKKLKTQIQKGEGLAGEVWQEKKTLFFSDVPASHMRIKSGLGDAKPANLLLTPVMAGSEFYGVIELGFFRQLQHHEIELVEKISSNLAIALSGIDIHNKTKDLLKASQELSTSLKLKEQELEYNFQELQNAHDETQRRELKNEREIKMLAEKYEQELRDLSKEEETRQQEIENLKKEIEEASLDNETIRALQKEIEAFGTQIDDLKETIKIKDMRIEKMRKKIRNSKSDT